MNWKQVIPQHNQARFLHDESKFCREVEQQYYSFLDKHGKVSERLREAVLLAREQFLRLYGSRYIQ